VNIAMALMVMMVSSQMVKPLDFTALPTVLLVTTLMRLSLNVASTRVVLMDGHNGPGAAGKVIESFGHVLIGDNFAVGLIVFAILVVINFVVVTKGAERIAEVGARFTLDAMPGKQMAIDADLNAGLIDEQEAKQAPRRGGRGSRLLRFDGRCQQVRARRRHGRPADPVHHHRRRLHHRHDGHGMSAGEAAAATSPGRGRRAGGADPGAADLGGLGDGGLARRQGRGHRQQIRGQVFDSPRSLGMAAASSSAWAWCRACRTWCSGSSAARWAGWPG
jgi:flagellar biosynthesis protein FlhA